MAEKFGQYLLRNQIVSNEQLNEALQCQVIFGGRLGTNLVELGYLTLDDLARLLSRRSGFPVAQVDELEELPKETLNALPRALIDKFKIIPMRIEAKTVHLAVCDPTDFKTIDEISFATGMRLKPYLLPELRMFYLLEKHYGIKREIRYIRLGRTLSHGKYGGAIAGAAQGGPATIVDAPDTANLKPSTLNAEELENRGFRALKQGEELTDELSAQDAAWQTPAAGIPAVAHDAPTVRGTIEAPAAVPHAPVSRTPAPVATPAIPAPAPAPAPTAAPAPAELSPFDAPPDMLLDETYLEPLEPLEEIPAAAAAAPPAPVPFPPPSSAQEAAEIRAYLQDAPDRDEVASAALRLARSHFATVAVFIVNKGTILGWRAAGGALDRQTIETLMLPVDADSILKPAASGKAFQGTVPKSGLNERLLAGLGRGLPLQAVAIPVTLKGRVVNVFYADNGAQGVNAAATGFLELLARDVSSAYERIILAKKRGSGEPAAT